jgi:N-sulfoglucosamine sulfohydrolase
MIGDDHGQDGACFGNPAVDTPNLDRLAASGTRFANGFATVSSCSPSRSVILTGLYSHTNGQYGLAHAANNQVTQPWVWSLPRILNQAGYRTALFGKNHVQPKEVYPYQVAVEGATVNRNVSNLARQAGEFFAKDEKPFFVVAAFHDPHRAGKGFANEQTYPGVKRTEYDPQAVRVPVFLPDDPKVREDLADYYQSVNRMDQGVGMLLAELERCGKAESTLVIYVSDNGIPFPGAKTTLYDAGIHLPMIVKVPGAKGGVVSRAMVSWIDITPTILEWTGTKAPYALPGRSVLPIVEQESPAGWDEVYASHVFHEVWMYYPMRAIRTRKYKLIWNLAHEQEWPVASDIAGSPSQKAVERVGNVGKRSLEAYRHRPEFELYDVESDPDELKNVVDEPGMAKVKSDLMERLKKWMKETKDPWAGHEGKEK